LRVPIYVLKADGGTMTLEASLNSPGQTILSGPAASVMGSVPYASREDETLVLDIGGTTTDMAVLVRGVPLLDPLGIELGGYKTLIRSLKTHSVAIGGDSVVRFVDGHLQVGPDRQGPAMAYGGRRRLQRMPWWSRERRSEGTRRGLVTASSRWRSNGECPPRRRQGGFLITPAGRSWKPRHR